MNGATDVLNPLGRGMSGNDVADLRELAIVWENSADICSDLGEDALSERDKRFAFLMRKAADILESEQMKS